MMKLSETRRAFEQVHAARKSYSEIPHHGYSPSDPKARDVASHGAQSALAAAGGEIHVYPWLITRKPAQEPCGVNMIGVTFEGALFYIGDPAFQLFVIIGIHRKSPYP